MAPVILCPVDFSEASRGALRYGAALAEHFGASLVLMTATEPLLAEAAAMETSASRFRSSTLEALRTFLAESIDRPLPGVPVSYESAIGKPDAEILRVARGTRADVIVMSSHGLTGFRKMFFGSTTERVLRETTAPMLVVPGGDRGPRTLVDGVRSLRRILAPVLLPGHHPQQLAVTRALAEALGVSTLLLHVVEPMRAALPLTERHLGGVERERRVRAEAELDALAAGIPRAESLLAFGEPSEEIVKVARDRGVGLIVIGLHSSPLSGPRVGTVTYRVLSAAGTPILVLPPAGLPAKARSAKAGNFPHGPEKPSGRERR
jgi:nucleotide-binding universal stress UspA family protein